MLTQIPVLDPAECDRVSEDICALRSQWIPRGQQPTAFFTLGVASYQDLSTPAEGIPKRDYYREGPIFNAVIAEKFGWLLGRVQRVLQACLGGDTQFSPPLGLPGFHIFEYHAIPTTDVASIHFDLQYQLIDWSDGGPVPDFTDPISFTLPTRLPAGGGGINGWDLTYGEMIQGRHFDVSAFLGSRRKTFHRYSLGTLAIHSGHRLHQIAGVADVRPGDQRITLQGHGLRRGGGWVLYW
jgi:hypothetical protein